MLRINDINPKVSKIIGDTFVQNKVSQIIEAVFGDDSYRVETVQEYSSNSKRDIISLRGEGAISVDLIRNESELILKIHGNNSKYQKVVDDLMLVNTKLKVLSENELKVDDLPKYKSDKQDTSIVKLIRLALHVDKESRYTVYVIISEEDSIVIVDNATMKKIKLRSIDGAVVYQKEDKDKIIDILSPMDVLLKETFGASYVVTNSKVEIGLDRVELREV